ncbi:MAG TPA: glycosyl transferase, partial [Sulfurihydrogenibium azorense]|nr:glycosyl transferase [Sulfurihydrogenibium azorense]
MLKKVLIFHFFILVLRVLYVLFRDIDLSPEEAQYWLWSKFLDLSYYSKPPLIAYLNFLSTSILGDTEIGVRINAIILGFFIAIITYVFSKELFK